METAQEKRNHRFNVVLDSELHYRVKLKAMEQRMTLKQLTTLLLEQWLNDQPGSSQHN